MRDSLSQKNSSTALALLTTAVVAGGTLAVVIAVARQALVAEHAWLAMIGLALLVAPVSSVKIPGVKADVVLGDAVTFACAALFGPHAAVIAAVADGAVTSLRLTRSSRKFLYNVATCATSMAGANLVTTAAFSQFDARGEQLPAGTMAVALGLFTLCYFLISTMLIAAYVAVSTHKPLLKLWKEKFLWTFMSYVGSGVSAFAISLLAGRMEYLVFLVAIGMMLVVSLFYRAYFRRGGEIALAHNA